MALQEFLASYAVKVDEDGARRLQRILEQNEESAKGLSSGFEAARRALAASAVCAEDHAAVNPRMSREMIDLKVNGKV